MELARITVCLNDYIAQFDYNSTMMNTKVNLYNIPDPPPLSLICQAPTHIEHPYRILQSALSILVFLRCLPLSSMALPFPSSPFSSTLFFYYFLLLDSFYFYFLLSFTSWFLLPLSSTACFCLAIRLTLTFAFTCHLLL